MKRYDESYEVGSSMEENQSGGDWIKYEDHHTVVKDLKKIFYKKLDSKKKEIAKLVAAAYLYKQQDELMFKKNERIKLLEEKLKWIENYSSQIKSMASHGV